MRNPKTALRKARELEAYLTGLSNELNNQITGCDATPILEDVRYARDKVNDAVAALENHVEESTK